MSKTLKRIIIALITLLTILGIGVKVSADTYTPTQTKTGTEKFFDHTRMLPKNDTSGGTGLLPQYYLSNYKRTVSLNDNRLNINSNSWDAQISEQIVYCAKHGSYVRYGTYDPAKHYIDKTGIKIQGETITGFQGNTIAQQIFNVSYADNLNLYQIAWKQMETWLIGSDKKYYDDLTTGHTESSTETLQYKNLTITADSDNINTTNLDITKIVGYVFDQNKAPDNVMARVDGSKTDSMLNMIEIIKKIGKEVNSLPYSEDIDGTGYTDPVQNLTALAKNGPEIVVMETGEHQSNGYKKSEEKYNYKNNIYAFILTALENAYPNETGAYSSEYTLNDIQAAYWLALAKYEGGKTPNSKRMTDNGRRLFERAEQYAIFLEYINKNGYNANINTNNVKTIANRRDGYYIVGPFTINYPEYKDISYIKALTVSAGEKTLIYDATNTDFEIILEDTGISSNGTRNFPKNNESFFIKVDASKINYAETMKLSAKLEYINQTEIDYETLETLANIYQYEGFYYLSYNMLDRNIISEMDTIYVTLNFGYKEKDKEHIITKHKEECISHKEDFTCCDGGDTTYANKNETKSYKLTCLLPYVQMKKEPKTAEAQKLIIAGAGKRNYVSKNITTTNIIDLTMELGGKVWVDEDTGKESIANGIKDSQEKLVPNIIVTLYRQDGAAIGTTVTNANGEYRFSGLNAMFKYFVKFTYNGQYYEPTYYTSPLDGANGWNRGNWQNNSNATDKINERETLNKKFESIGSYPNNYEQGTYGITYTKEQLLKAKVIDEFGNLVINESSAEASNPEIKSMITYVKDCRIDAYTGNNTNTGAYSYDTYPTPDIFMIDDGGRIVFMKLNILDAKYDISKVRKADISMLYPSAYYVNLGLHPREDADLALKKDVDNVTLEINGQTHKYTYDTLENKTNENGEQTWDISVRLSDTYYSTAYSRELYKEDYLYKVSNYGNEDAQKYYGKTKNDELNVYITYKIMVRNQALSLRTRVDEIVDYYDQDLEYVANRSYIQISKGTNNVGKYLAMAEVNSKYSAVTNINGYSKLYVKGLGQNAQKINDTGANDGGVIQEGLYLDAGQTAYVYLTFKVVKDNRDGEQWVRLDENYENEVAIGVGKENIAEINGYSTKYAEGTKVPNIGDVSGKPAGKIDKDSNPGNLNPTDVPKDGTVNYENFEDDTDKAPNIRIVLNRDDNKTRIISGSVFEDNRTNEIGVTTVGNGFKENNETLINGVTVQLVELMENGKEFVWREFGSKQNGTASVGTGAGTGNVTEETPIINRYNLIPNYKFDENSHKGEYAFKSFAPGKYVVRFIYGDTEKTVVPNAQGGNAKSYNGQDYKSTTYQKGVVQNKTYTWDRNTQYVNGQLVLSNRPEDHYTISTFKADASNNATANFNTKEANAYLYDITASDARQDLSDAKDIASRREQVINYSGKNVTNYIAEVLASHKTDYNTLNDKNTLLKDLMQNTKMTAETGLMVIEFEKDQTTTEGNNKQNIYQITNVNLGLEERPKAQLVIEKEVSNVKLTLADGSILFDTSKSANNVLWRDHKGYDLGYKGNLLDEAKFGSIENIRKNNASSFGLIQLSMDEELMHGATIKIDYNVTVKNVGEVDYKDNKFYYTGEKSNIAKVVTTTANKVIDYVANNLQFYAKDNSNWRVINQDDIKTNGLVNDKLKNSLEQYNTIIVTEGLAKDLVPELYKEKVDKNAQASVSVPLVLTQLITAENEGDDLTYRNIVEIVQTSNTVGRRMEYSVVGNQDPLKEPEELDSSKAEVIKILPPFGGIAMYVLISVITLAVVAIVVTGVIFIKKKVLKN